MKNPILPLFLVALLGIPASANVWDAVQIKGRTDHENPVSYAHVEGGSQGGLQSSWAAGLDPDVSLARPGITWGCDFYMTAGPSKRLKGGWHIPYAPGLDYFDAINHIRRAQCPVEITRAGLGDYTCPPSGQAAYYNAIRTPKSILWVQGSEHGLVPPEPNQTFTVSSGHEQTEAESASQSASSDVKGP